MRQLQRCDSTRSWASTVSVVTLHVASEQQKILHSEGIRAGRLTQIPGKPIPDGLYHAVDEGATDTLCGLPLAALFDWPNLAWPHGARERCATCAELARSSG